jgi:hypothetical protein
MAGRTPVPRIELMLDCPDPVALAPFWAAALGYEIGAGDGDPYVELVPTDGRPILCLQRVPEPKQGKVRMHLDLYVPQADVPAELERLVALGATPMGSPVLRRSGRFNFQILTDPVGTEFCLCGEDEG